MTPARPDANPEFLPFALPSIGEEEIAEVVDALRSGWITTGPKTRQFEAEFADYVGAQHAVAVNSATAGLHLALEAVGVGPGDRVFTTPYTFTATAEVIRYLGADPVFVDIDPQTFNIDPDKLACAIRKYPDAKAVIPVHFAGQACDMLRIVELAGKHGLKIVEDAAHALPTTFDGRRVGSIGDVTVFSFYATKTITTGEGGMVTTDDDACAKRMRIMRLHGIDRDVFDRYSSPRASWFYEVVAPGFKYNMTDIAAAMGIHQLRKAEQFRLRREAIAARFSEGLQGLPLALPWVARPHDIHAWHFYVVGVDQAASNVSRDELIERLRADGIGASVHFIPLHLQPYWRDRYALRPGDFPVATRVYQGALSLPIYPKMTDQSVERVVRAMRRALGSDLACHFRRAA